MTIMAKSLETNVDNNILIESDKIKIDSATITSEPFEERKVNEIVNTPSQKQNEHTLEKQTKNEDKYAHIWNEINKNDIITFYHIPNNQNFPPLIATPKRKKKKKEEKKTKKTKKIEQIIKTNNIYIKEFVEDSPPYEYKYEFKYQLDASHPDINTLSRMVSEYLDKHGCCYIDYHKGITSHIYMCDEDYENHVKLDYYIIDGFIYRERRSFILKIFHSLIWVLEFLWEDIVCDRYPFWGRGKKIQFLLSVLSNEWDTKSEFMKIHDLSDRIRIK